MRGLCPILLALAAAFAAPAQTAKHVVLVSIDGFAAYHLHNPELELPNIRQLIREGVWAASAETVFPSVTHPSHTTLLTGAEPRLHGVLSNSLRNRDTGETFHPTNKRRTDIVKIPTIFDAAKQRGLGTAAFFWPETKDDPSIDFNIPEVFTPTRKADIEAVDSSVLRELRQAEIPIDLYFRWYGTHRHGAGDVILAEAAAHAIRRHKPNLLAIHILITDQRQHGYGPHHYLSHAALTDADYCVGVLRQAVEQAGIANETTFIIAADHGFHSVYHEMNIRPAFARAGVLGQIELRGGGWNMAVVLKDGFDERRDLPKLQQAFAELRESPYITRIVGPDDMHALGQPRYEEDPHALGHYFVLPDIDTYLVSDAESDSMERRPKASPSHSHGYLPQHPRMHTSLVLSGAGIRRGATIGHTKNLSVAPTIAKLLGLELPKATGQPIEEALERR